MIKDTIMKTEMDFRNPSASWETTIDMPASLVWTAFEDYGNWIKFDAALKSVTTYEIREGIGSKPILIREVIAHAGLHIREELVTKDSNNYILSYRLVKWEKSPQVFLRVETEMRLTPIDESHCKITWKVNTEMRDTPPETYAKVLIRQQNIFKRTTNSAIAYLSMQLFTKNAMDFLTQKSIEAETSIFLGNNAYEYDEYPLLDQTKWPLPKMCKGLPLSEALSPKKLSTIMKRVLELGYLQASKFLQIDPENETMKGKFDYEGAARKLVSTYGNEREQDMTANLLKNWDTDEEFCQQYLQGINPLLIEVVKDMQQLPTKMRYLSVRDPGNRTKSVQALINEKRLFIVDYKDLEQFLNHQGLNLYAPFVAIYKQILDDGETRLNILAIQIERDENAPIFTPDSPHKNRFKIAKMIVACADTQVHQFGYHLGISHFGNEPVAVAINRKLPESHPLRDILAPHFKDTIGINYAVRLALATKSDQAFANNTFAVGYEHGRRISSVFWQKFHFFESSFPKELEARGFFRDNRDGLGNYFYRDDGFKLWDAIGNYAQNFVYRHYQADHDVAIDEHLQTFCADLASPEGGNYPGFPAQITTRDLLWQVLQIIIWNASALHSVLNYSQWPYTGFVGNRHNALYKPMPKEDGKDVSDDYIYDMLAPTFAALFQMGLSWIMSSLDTDETLVKLRALKNIYPDIDNRLQLELKEVSYQIERRNDKLIAEGKTPYVYLLPENVASSCNI